LVELILIYYLEFIVDYEVTSTRWITSGSSANSSGLISVAKTHPSHAALSVLDPWIASPVPRAERIPFYNAANEYTVSRS